MKSAFSGLILLEQHTNYTFLFIGFARQNPYRKRAKAKSKWSLAKMVFTQEGGYLGRGGIEMVQLIKQRRYIMVTESKKKANAKWDANNKKRVCFGFMVNSDADILEWLDSLSSGTKITEVKKAIRSYIKSQETTKGE